MPEAEGPMSKVAVVKRVKPGFGKRGSAKVKPVVRTPAPVTRWSQMFGRWIGKKEPPKRSAAKGFGSRR
jgi:hypothetical protein